MPKPTAVYRIYDSADALLYVGITHAGRERIWTHRGAAWGPRIARVEWEEFPNRAQAAKREYELIAALCPPCNARIYGATKAVVPTSALPCPLCLLDGLSVPARTYGWCFKHYARWWKHGDPLHVQTGGPTRTDPIARFWAKVDKDGPVPDCHPELGQCWVWTAAMSSGYGVFGTGGRRAQAYAHRWSWEHANRPIPAGLTIDHLCRTRACVRPSHLEPVPLSVNLLRGDSPPARNAVKTCCGNGHEYTSSNTRIHKGKRHCRDCERDWARAARARRRLDLGAV